MKQVILPWPDKRLSPNARVHFAQKAKVFAQAKNEAYMLALSAGMRGYQGRQLKLVFMLPDKRRRDLDNLHASMKAALDGLALAVGCDDSEFCPIMIDRAPPEIKGGGVRVELWEKWRGVCLWSVNLCVSQQRLRWW